MSVPDIVDRLAAGVEILDRPRFRGDPRHRSVAVTIDWSYRLLPAGPAALFEQLGVFAGPFHLDAARAVATSDDFDGDLEELVHASLVTAEIDGGTTRYRMLETVRHVARDRLRRRGAMDATYDRFVEHVLTRSREILSDAAVSWRPALIRELIGSYDDLAEAVRWCIAHDDDPRRSFLLSSSFWAIVHQGHTDEVVDLMRRLFARFPDRSTSAAAQAIAVLATAEYVTGRPHLAAELAEETIAEHTGTRVPAVTLRRVLGQARNALGDGAGAIAAFEEGVDIGRRLGLTAMADELEVAAAQVAADEGDVDAALVAIGGVIERAGANGSVIVAAWAATTRAWILLRTDPQQALVAAEGALADARRTEYPIAIAVNLRTMAYAHLLCDRLDDAAGALADLLDELLGRGALSNARVLVDVAAALAQRTGHPTSDSLAATARSLPITTMAAGRYEIVPRPATSAPPVSRFEVFGAVRHLLADLDAAEPEPTPTGDEDVENAHVIRRLGDVWEFVYGGRSVMIRDSKGINDIVRLVASAGREIHCLDLADVGVEQPSTGEMIDTIARRQYEERIRDLQAEIDEAELHQDYARVYRHQAELDALIDHLTAAIGGGRRTRRSADSGERARSAVTHRIRAAIRQLDRIHPPLGRHLSRSIRTGAYCAYEPAPGARWHIEDPVSALVNG